MFLNPLPEMRSITMTAKVGWIYPFLFIFESAGGLTPLGPHQPSLTVT